ncbi:hypothetical protein SORBI_3004G030850 [Sorghum bicolor]|uniref:Uncharacterized protein n=1 Tax=Sorghum bicolor TaxID=4558 RepID=C5XTV4_SORBI|nr:hypothetical protein SORBI_3004G030850 [Sorghum bicolor]
MTTEPRSRTRIGDPRHAAAAREDGRGASVRTSCAHALQWGRGGGIKRRRRGGDLSAGAKVTNKRSSERDRRERRRLAGRRYGRVRPAGGGGVSCLVLEGRDRDRRLGDEWGPAGRFGNGKGWLACPVARLVPFSFSLRGVRASALTLTPSVLALGFGTKHTGSQALCSCSVEVVNRCSSGRLHPSLVLGEG